jgi:hypothetical protein
MLGSFQASQWRIGVNGTVALPPGPYRWMAASRNRA